MAKRKRSEVSYGYSERKYNKRPKKYRKKKVTGYTRRTGLMKYVGRSEIKFFRYNFGNYSNNTSRSSYKQYLECNSRRIRL